MSRREAAADTYPCPACGKPITKNQSTTTWSTGQVTHQTCGDPTNPKDVARARWTEATDD